MTSSRVLRVFCLITVFSFGPFAFATDQYWISFSGLALEHYPGYPKYLMKIDALGNVVVPPRMVLGRILAGGGPLGTGSAISSNGGLLNLWVAGLPQGAYVQSLYSVVIRKDTLKVVSRHKTPVSVVNTDHFGVTNNPSNNFLAVQVLEPPFQNVVVRNVGYALSESGAVLPGVSWFFSSPPTSFSSMNVSSAGKVLLFENPIQGHRARWVMLQPLGANGRPVGSPVTIAKGQYIDALDISNTLPGNRRFVLYRVLFGVHGGAFHHALFLQVVDAKTLQNIGGRITVAYNVGDPYQQAAIDPVGQFVLYGELLRFQALDATGHPSGLPKSILPDQPAAGGIDILKD